MSDLTSSPLREATPGVTTPWRVAAALMVVQAVALFGVGIWSGFDGGSARSWSFAATLVVLAGCVAALAWLLNAGRSAGRTPTLLWNALLLPVGFTVGDGGAPWAGWLIIAVAVLTFVATVLARPHEVAARDGQD